MIEYMNVVVTDEEKKLLLFNSLPEEYQSVNIFRSKKKRKKIKNIQKE